MFCEAVGYVNVDVQGRCVNEPIGQPDGCYRADYHEDQKTESEFKLPVAAA